MGDKVKQGLQHLPAKSKRNYFYFITIITMSYLDKYKNKSDIPELEKQIQELKNLRDSFPENSEYWWENEAEIYTVTEKINALKGKKEARK